MNFQKNSSYDDTQFCERNKIKMKDQIQEKGYGIFNFDGTGMLEIQKIDEQNVFLYDEEAVEQAIEDGIKMIPIEELPKNFDRKYLGWIDTPENRRRIEEYCRR